MSADEPLPGRPSKKYPVVETRRVQVTIDLTTGTSISGDVHVKPGGIQNRVSDLLNVNPQEFVPVTDAVVTRPGGEVRTAECAIVPRSQIALLLADD